MSEKKFRFTIDRPVLCWKYETIFIEADSEEEALEMCKDQNAEVWYDSAITDEWDVERYEKPEITYKEEIKPKPLHHVCEYCKQQPGVEPWVSGYVVRCYNKKCPTHPLFYCTTAEEAFRAWDDYWAGYDKMCNNE